MPNLHLIRITRDLFEEHDALCNAISACDVVIHFAGMNRGDSDEILKTNEKLAKDLVSALQKNGNRPHIIFASSTHIDKDTPYGQSKRAATDILNAWADESGGSVTTVVLPNIFGEHGRPFYNSVISTFCYQIANKLPSVVEVNNEIELMHVHKMGSLLLELLDGKSGGIVRPAGVRITVTELLEKLYSLSASYFEGIMPNLDSDMDLALFNTFRSYLFPKYYPVALQRHVDERGSLIEVLKSNNGGQSFISTTGPSSVRGNHFHFFKVERFLVLSGRARIRVRRLFHGAVDEFVVDGSQPCYVDIPTLHTHSITNVGSRELLTLFWSHELYDPEFPDTFVEVV